MMETERLFFRHWTTDDKDELFQLAKDPEIGWRCGWPAHKTVEDSINTINNVFTGKENYAICLKGEDKTIGCITLMFNKENKDECELGYWLGRDYWGKGIMPEACRELIRHAFEDLKVSKIWCCYYEGNEQSRKVQEKLGFKFQKKKENVRVALLNEVRNDYVNLLTKEDWEKQTV